VPRQLPPAVGVLLGREPELARLDALLPPDGASTVAVPIAVVSGPAGAGKTALAVRWSHLRAARFPDGQLYATLHGSEPADVLEGFLGALGVAHRRIPADLDARTALYRSALAGRRVLVVLDDAADAAHVRPLLPATPGCMTVVTSTRPLTPLVAAEGAHPIVVNPAPSRQTPSRDHSVCRG
jgi:AAA domain-containing protein